jgi:hypothetical protein
MNFSPGHARGLRKLPVQETSIDIPNIEVKRVGHLAPLHFQRILATPLLGGLEVLAKIAERTGWERHFQRRLGPGFRQGKRESNSSRQCR